MTLIAFLLVICLWFVSSSNFWVWTLKALMIRKLSTAVGCLFAKLEKISTSVLTFGWHRLVFGGWKLESSLLFNKQDYLIFLLPGLRYAEIWDLGDGLCFDSFDRSSFLTGGRTTGWWCFHWNYWIRACWCRLWWGWSEILPFSQELGKTGIIKVRTEQSLISDQNVWKPCSCGVCMKRSPTASSVPQLQRTLYC